MSEIFYYLHLKFVPKIVILAGAILRQREVVIEVPKHLVQLSQLERMGENLGEREIAFDLARRAALGTFPTVAERILGLFHEDSPQWDENRPPVMDERPCDYEENGTKAWRIT